MRSSSSLSMRLLAGFLFGVAAHSALSAERPHIVYVTVDELGL